MTDGTRGGAADAETSGIGASAVPGRERRMTAGRKRDAVLRVLRGEPLEIVARELSVTAADVSGWRDAFQERGRRGPEVARAGRPGRDDRPVANQGRRADPGYGAASRQDRAARGWERRRPFRAAEIEATSPVASISTRRRHGVARVARAAWVARVARVARAAWVWDVPRAGLHRGRKATVMPSAPRRRPLPRGPMAMRP